MKNEKVFAGLFIPLLLVIIAVNNITITHYENAPEWLPMLLSFVSVAAAIALIIITIRLIRDHTREKKRSK